MEGAGGGSGSGLLPRSDHQSQHSQLFGVSPPDISTPPLTVDAISDSQQVEAASPISSRPPAPSSLNYEELIRLSSGGGQMAVEDDPLVGEEADRSGGGGGGSGGAGNRWPRQETLALLKIRSDMDSAFRDATLKGPLWDEVSRKLGEMGYKRSAKKCKEKFENVQKYYKRTKEGRGGRQDGKTYKFFTQLEALHNAASVGITTNTATSIPLNVAPSSFGISNPIPISSVKIISSSSQTPMGIFSPLPDHFTVRPPSVAAPPMGVSFSSNTSSASTEDEEEEDDDDEEIGGFDVDLEGEPSSTNVAGTSRKRRRGTVKKGSSSSSGRSRSHKMVMEFFQGLMKQVMEKQEGMQHKFLEAIEKREQDRLIREETWKRQEMARLSREQERMAQERTISASRDAAIIALLQKFTGQTIQLPAVNIPSPTPQQQYDVPMPVAMPVPLPVPAPASTPVSVPVPLSSVPPPPLQPQTSLPQQQIQKTQLQNQPPSNTMPLDHHHHHHPMISSSSSSYQEISQGGGDGPSAEPSIVSSRWPKPEVLALIKLRGGLESRYQENCPKGPLWEEISSGMQRMGYKRSAKRCKEKWENINKYFKKVKESNKKRREDSKTCPYFNELDALYRKKNLLVAGGGSDDTVKFEQDPIINMAPSSSDHAPETPHSSIPQPQSQSQTTQLAASLFGEGTEEQPAEPTKPEDIVNELMELQDLYRPASTNDVNNHQDEEEHEGEEEEDDDEGEHYCSDDDDDDIPEEKRSKNNKMDYKIEFQRRNVGNSSGVASEFKSMAVV